MSDQGFHEVQLSGKQLVFLFMSAVVLMVVVFLLGVNVGRGVRGVVGDTEVSAQADAAEATAPDGTPAEGSAPGAKPAQPELSYHDMLLAATPGADKGAAAEKPPTEPPPTVSEEPPPSPKTSPTPAATPTPAPAAPATTAPKPSGRADWFLQTGAYSTEAVANGQVAKLKQLKVPAFVVPPGADKLYRVRIGPYTDRAEAEQVNRRLARQGHPSSITR